MSVGCFLLLACDIKSLRRAVYYPSLTLNTCLLKTINTLLNIQIIVAGYSNLWMLRSAVSFEIPCKCYTGAFGIRRSNVENSECLSNGNGMKCAVQVAAFSNSCSMFVCDLLHPHNTKARMVSARYSKH